MTWSLMMFWSLRAVSILCGNGIPCVMIADSKATTASPFSTPWRTSSEIRKPEVLEFRPFVLQKFLLRTAWNSIWFEEYLIEVEASAKGPNPLPLEFQEFFQFVELDELKDDSRSILLQGSFRLNDFFLMLLPLTSKLSMMLFFIMHLCSSIINQVHLRLGYSIRSS